MNELTRYLEQYYDGIEGKEFYRYLFPEGELEKQGEYVEGKYCGIAVEVVGGKKNRVRRYSITDGLEKVDCLLESDHFCLMSPISYAGKNRTSTNARFLYALAFDLDGVRIKEDGTPQGLIDLFYQINGPAERLPKPTFVVSSGTGLHLYYVFEHAIPLFPNIVKQLMKYKREMTRMLWQDYITKLSNNVQQESLFQGFRMVGTITKKGDRVRAFETGKRVTMEYLNSFVEEQYQVTEYTYKSKLTLAEAKVKYPEWYEKRIVKGEPRGTWTTNRAVYDWWKRRILHEAKTGHRYYCIMMLAVYAQKAGISYEELEQDAFALLPEFEKLTTDEYNHFEETDVIDALEAYNDRYITYPINSISHLTDIPIQKNKRNYRNQKDHIKLMNTMKQFKKDTGENVIEGRPKGSGTKENIIQEYQMNHPNARKVDCIRDTGLSKPTVYKYWK